MTSSNLFDDSEERIFTIMKICELRDEERQENQLPHLHDFYSIIWIQDGQAVHATDFVEYVLEQDSILFVPPGLKHRLVLDQMAGGYSILFNEEFVRYNRKNYTPLKEYDLFNNPEFKSIVKIEESLDKEKLSNLINLMLEEFQRTDEYSQDVVLNLLHLFLLKSIRLFENQYHPLDTNEEDTDNFSIIRFKKLIEDNYRTEKSVSSYADMLSMNPTCLNEIAKKTTGITAGEMIRNRVIEEAKQKLFGTDLNGKEIAYSLGFDDPSYFSRFFKKYTGFTIKDFRDISRKKYHKI
ncbi:helix-turn-helix domain-containing protein [uncultured Sunxiuqinia sp.]|uniref:helix-turn-helix domain-containing protein n=1 Tax=uncultured Sunxiuqinia sp. TaxID=1573825 RepID=UPI002AA7681E|nr:helix-turn-helix domain-containing protein [uncultured Sunxiuqinia sp.]